MSYEWYTDPSGNRHFQRTFPKKGKAAAAKPVVVEAPVEAEAVEIEPVEVASKAAPKKAPAKKKSNG